MLNKTFSLLPALTSLIRRSFPLWIVAILVICAPLTASASEAEIKGDIEVDVSGKDAVDARAKAMEKAENDALNNLLQRFTSPQQAQSIVESLPPARIASMVRGIEVLSERISDRRYRAHLLVTFDGQEISKLVSTANPDGGSSLETATTAFVVIPVYEEGMKTVLWEEPNPWRAIWKSVGLENNASGVVVPYGDPTDASSINAGNASSATFSSLSNLTNRYGANEIVLLQAKFEATPTMVLTVIKRRLNRTRNEINLLTYRSDPQETKEMLLTRAAMDIVEKLQDIKSHQVKSNFVGGEHNRIMLLASISTMASWTELRGKLTKLPMVDKVDVIAISPQQVDISLGYRGTQESLEAGILSLNLRLSKTPNYWVVSRD